MTDDKPENSAIREIALYPSTAAFFFYYYRAIGKDANGMYNLIKAINGVIDNQAISS